MFPYLLSQTKIQISRDNHGPYNFLVVGKCCQANYTLFTIRWIRGIKAWGSEGGNSQLLSNHAAYTPKVHWLRVSAFSWSKIKLSEFGLSCLCNHPQHDCYICRSRELIWNYVYGFTGIWRPFTQFEQVRVSVRKYR